MTRAQLEHLIRAAASITGDHEIVVIGSQAILGQFPDAPAELLVSAEADLYPRHLPERTDLISGAIGELSPFHETFGYYADGVGPETATLPTGWEQRLVPIRVGDLSGLCLEVHDLVLSKWAVGREEGPGLRPGGGAPWPCQPRAASREDRSGLLATGGPDATRQASLGP